MPSNFVTSRLDVHVAWQVVSDFTPATNIFLLLGSWYTCRLDLQLGLNFQLFGIFGKRLHLSRWTSWFLGIMARVRRLKLMDGENNSAPSIHSEKAWD